MGLITLTLPPDIIQHIKNLIVDHTQALANEPESPTKEDEKATIAKWQTFINLVENQDPSRDVEVLPLSAEGPGAGANLMILEAFYTRDSGGSEIVLKDQEKITKLINVLYKPGDPNSSLAYFNVCKGNYFEWWEKVPPNDRLRGIVRINK